MQTELIRYRVALADPAGHRYALRLVIARPNPDGQALRLPAWVPGSYLIRDFSRQIETLRAHCGDQPVAVHKRDSHTWQCAPCNGPLTVDYTVYAWDLSVRGAHFDERHAFFNGCSLFLAVCGQEAKPCLLQLEPPAHARDWRVYTSLPPAQGRPDAAARYGFGEYLARNYDDLLDHPVEMGTPQIVHFEAAGVPHEIVFTGPVPNLDLARVAADAKRICEAQIALFDPQHHRPAFAGESERYVFLTTVTADGYGGLEHRSSTALMTRRQDLPSKGQEPPEGYPSFLGLISHEYFHTWLVKRIKPAAFVPYDLSRPNHTALLWVFEGFTSYYDDRMLLRAGVIDETTYFRLLARTLDRVRAGAGRTKQSLAQSSFDAWTRFYKQDENSPNALVSYYAKGALLACGLDLEIRHQSAGRHTLDDVLRLLWQRYGAPDSPGLEEQAMPALIHEATGVDLGEYLTTHVTGCADIPLATALGRVGIELVTQAEDPTPSLQIRTREEAGGLRIQTVHEAGAGHRAGLSAGDILVAIDGLRVTDAGTLRAHLSRYQPGDTCTVHVFRQDELRSFTATLDAPVAGKHHLKRTPGQEATW